MNQYIINNEYKLTVSQEFITVKDITDGLANFLTGVKNLVKFKTEVAKQVGTVPRYGNVRRILEKNSYETLKEKVVACPAGLTSPYIQYMEALEKGVSISECLITEILMPFSKMLGQCINNPNLLAKLRNNLVIRDFKPHNLDMALADIGNCFEVGNSSIETRFGSLFSSNEEVKIVLEKADLIVSRQANINHKKVIDLSEIIDAYLDLLIKRIKDPNAKLILSKENISTLSKLSNILAHEMEFFGLMVYQLTQLNVALNNFVKDLK